MQQRKQIKTYQDKTKKINKQMKNMQGNDAVRTSASAK